MLDWRTHHGLRRARRAALLAAVVATLGAGAGAAATPREVDTERSTITVHVFKAGLFRAFGDNHEIQAFVKDGSFDENDPAAGVRVVVNVQQMRVLDPGLSPGDRSEVQARMLGPTVLDVNRFPEIRFESTGIERVQPDLWSVRGRLTLHGETRPVTIKVAREGGHYRGSLSLKQTEFGITPISVAGGAVRVKDVVTIDVDIVTRSDSTAAK